MARILGTTPQKVMEIGDSMGLPKKPQLTRDQQRRMYVTIIRQNWHVLPDQQLMELLGWDRAHYEWTLKEDDFLGIKLGSVKPWCEPLSYQEPSEETRRRAGEIKRLAQTTFGSSINQPGEPAFQFVTDMSSLQVQPMRDPQGSPSNEEIDLTRGWILESKPKDSGVPIKVIEDFGTYLRSGFGCDVSVAEGNAPESKNVVLSIDASIAETPGSFEINVQPQEVRVLGRDLVGVRQAISFLQDQMEKRQGPYLGQGKARCTTRLTFRCCYPYFSFYGDPLMESDTDMCPDGLLMRLSRTGVNSIWLQGVLRNCAPSKIFPEFGEGCETRLSNLNRIVERAQGFGMKVYLYMNEPRSMPAEFFAARPQMKGTHDSLSQFAMCTSAPEVREWLSDSLAHVFSHVPGLGGIYIVCMSENLTNCFAQGNARFCPRCSKRRGSEVVAEHVQALRDGVRRSSAEADVIVDDWGWGYAWVRNGADTAEIIERLPKDVILCSVSEWDKPVNRGGFHAKVNEYSISVVGPGPRALRNWELARQRGLTAMADVQFGNSWELAAVPYIPVPNLIVKHCQNLLDSKLDIRGLMLSWTFGGYPSPNFEAAKEFYFSPAPEAEQALQSVAERRYGREAAPPVLDAWRAFSTAFEEFPYGVAIYDIPIQHAPANPLRVHPTGYQAAMTLFPYDDYKSWVGPYPVDSVERQFEKMAKLWQAGLATFRAALERVGPLKRPTAVKDLGIAETCYIHFQSVANQIRFYRLRDQLASAKPEIRRQIAAHMIRIAEDEIGLAKRQYFIARRDSRIAYEATCHYFYRPLDLAEKVLNCMYVIERLKAYG
jgi:hypothetical protein